MDINLIRQLREQTGVSIGECKIALEEAGGDIEKAVEILKRRGESIAAKKTSRETRNGIVDAYIHSDGKAGALVELHCETDFVARNPIFRELVHDLAMQVVAMGPLYVKLEDIPEEILAGERDIFFAQVKDSGKPRHIIDQVVEGKMQKYKEQICLLCQPFIKDQDKTVRDHINEVIAKLGENITIEHFVRFEI